MTDAGKELGVDELDRLVTQRRRESEYARDALKSPPWPDHVRLGWWEPHQVYVIHQEAAGRYKVGLTHHHSRRIREHTARGRAVVVATVTVPNRWAAKLVESAVLEQTDHARVAGARTYLHGHTEHWTDAVPPPDLEPIVDRLAADSSLRSWSVSVVR